MVSSLVDDYVSFTKDVSSPTIFRRWAAIHAVGSAVERRVWTQMVSKLYPNIFVFLISPPGIGKTMATRFMADLLRKSQSVTIGPNDVTKQSLLDSLGAATKSPIIGTEPVEYHYLALIITEMTNFMGKYDIELAGLLTELFDCPETNEEQKRTHDKGKMIIAPAISALVCTATKNLGATISDDMWGSGFMARFILVFSGEKIIPANLFSQAAMDKKLGNSILMGLKRLGEMKGEMVWEPEAQAALYTFFLSSEETAPLHNRLTNYATRRWLHLAKLAMIAALAYQRLEVLLEDFETAKGWLDEAEAAMPEIFKDMVHHEDGAILEEMRAEMFALHIRSGRKPIPDYMLFNFLSKRASTFAVPRMVEVAVAAGMFDRVAGTGGQGQETLYIPKPPQPKDMGHL